MLSGTCPHLAMMCVWVCVHALGAVKSSVLSSLSPGGTEHGLLLSLPIGQFCTVHCLRQTTASGAAGGVAWSGVI